MTDIVNPSVLPGFMELLPEDQLVFNKMREIIEKNFIKYGFFPLDTPVIEKEEVLLSKGGGETQKQIFKIDKQSRKQALRFDLTVPLARYVALNANELSFPFRRYQIGKVYRGERNQRGRYKEFYQCDIDIIGNEKLGIYNDAEIPAVIYSVFRDMNFTDLQFHLNNRKLLNGFFESLGIEDMEASLRAIDKLAKIGEDKVREELLEAGLNDGQINEIYKFIKDRESNQEVLELLDSYEIENELFKTGLEELKTVYEYMQKFGIPEDNIRLNLSITRGLDYYTGTVYETFLVGYESIGSVCSGGRYEDLASNFTKQKYPGIGLSIGLTRLYYQLNEAGLLNFMGDKGYIRALVIPMDECNLDYSIDVVDSLRKLDIRSQIYTEKAKMKKKFQYADRINADYAVIIGESEMEENKVSLRNMKTGEQEIIDKEKLGDFLK